MSNGNEYNRLQYEWRRSVTDDIKDHETRLRQMENFNARTLGWVCGVQFVGLAVIWVLERFFR